MRDCFCRDAFGWLWQQKSASIEHACERAHGIAHAFISGARPHSVAEPFAESDSDSRADTLAVAHADSNSDTRRPARPGGCGGGRKSRIHQRYRQFGHALSE